MRAAAAFAVRGAGYIIEVGITPCATNSRFSALFPCTEYEFLPTFRIRLSGYILVDALLRDRYEVVDRNVVSDTNFTLCS